ncbi:MAG: hypothetical protein WD669_03740 [Pirellulales bacterium]
MNRYTVVWHDDAQNQLAQVWMGSTDRAAITEAAHVIDIELAVDAGSKGVEVEGELRELVVPPLRVLFGVSEPDRLVRVVHAEMA